MMTHQITISDPLWGRIQTVSHGLNLPPEELFALALDHYVDHYGDYENIPNAETVEAMRDGDLKRNLTHHTDLESLFKSWEDL
jgi:hypothetical protein